MLDRKNLKLRKSEGLHIRDTKGIRSFIRRKVVLIHSLKYPLIGKKNLNEKKM